MYRWYYMKTHLKNHKWIALLYVLAYVFLVLFAIAYFYVDFADGAYDKYFDSMEIIHIMVCILGAFPVLFLSQEVIERRKYPYVTLYAYHWSRIDNLLAHLISVIFPVILFGVMTVLYWNTELEAICYEGMLIGDLILHVTLVFFLSALGFFLAVLLRSYTISLLIVLGYVLLMQYMELPGMIPRMITLDYGEIWQLGAIVTLGVGVLLNELGMLLLDRK